ncbi:hypothetical protein EVAR_33788_1 [Eumeta japonica]|uniref:Kinetochore protein SPC25 n=1 Tax=Eumeta variegata TaxID=151549 RepID=A0A4C1VVQ7_EUMVA|nr:hypothetical protein EVAR_33788_1 [Eumeta japonica]
MIAGAGWFVKKDVIASDLKAKLRQAQRTFSRADEGPFPSLHNLTPQCERSPGGCLSPRDLLISPPSEDKVTTTTALYQYSNTTSRTCWHIGDETLRLCRHMVFRVVEINPKLTTCEEIQKKLQETNDIIGALCCIRKSFLLLKNN